MPADLVRTRPRLGLLRARAYLELSQFAAAEPGVCDAEAALSTRADLSVDEQRTLLGQVEAIRSTIAINLGDTPGAQAYAHRALELLTPDDEQSRIELAQVLLNLADANTVDDDPTVVQAMYARAIELNRQVGNVATTITAMSGLGRVQTLQGLLYEAADTLREALALATEGGRSLPWPSTGKAHVFLGALHYEWNDLDGAVHHLTEGIRLCQQWRHVYHVAEGFLFLAKVRAAQGDLQGGYMRLQQAKQLVDTTTLSASPPVPIPKLRHLSERLAATQAEFLLAQGEVEAATSFAQRCGLSLTVTPDRSPTAYDLTLAHLLVTLGRLADADRVLEELAPEREAERWTDDAIKVLVAQAATLEADGKTMQAITVLGRSLQLAKPGGYVRTFLDEGVRVHRLLSLLASYDGATADYACALLAAFSASRTDTELREAALVEPLSEREGAVLRLLATGLSSPEVAARLIIAVSTVRSHIKHIYAKLQVHTRAEAVRRARALRLV